MCFPSEVIGYCEVIDILCDIELSDVDKLLFSMQLFE